MATGGPHEYAAPQLISDSTAQPLPPAPQLISDATAQPPPPASKVDLSGATALVDPQRWTQGQGALAVALARRLRARSTKCRRARAPGNNRDGGAAPCVFSEDVRWLRQYAAARSRVMEDAAGRSNRTDKLLFRLTSFAKTL